MTLYSLILVSLAVLRLSILIAVEDGPFFLLSKIREMVGVRFGWGSWVAQGIQCPLCISFWLSLLAAILLGGGVLEWLAIAGLVSILVPFVMRVWK